MVPITPLRVVPIQRYRQKDPNGGYGYPMIKDYSDFLKSQQKFKNK